MISFCASGACPTLACSPKFLPDGKQRRLRILKWRPSERLARTPFPSRVRILRASTEDLFSSSSPLETSESFLFLHHFEVEAADASREDGSQHSGWGEEEEEELAGDDDSCGEMNSGSFGPEDASVVEEEELSKGSVSGGTTTTSGSEFVSETTDEDVDLLVEFLLERTGANRNKAVTEGKSSASKGALLPKQSSEPPCHAPELRTLSQTLSAGLDSEQRGLPKISGTGDVTDSGDVELVEQVLNLARNVPQNRTLEEFLTPFVGQISTEDGNSLLEALAAEKLTYPLLSFFQWMRLSEPCLTDSRSFCVVFIYLASVDMVDQALTIYRNLPSEKEFHAVQVYNTLLAALVRHDRKADMVSVLEDMNTRNIGRDSVTYSILITSARKKKDQQLQNLWSAVNDMMQSGSTPDVFVMGTIIKGFCDAGHHKHASMIAVSMEGMGLKPNVVIYNTLMDAYAKCSKMEEAEGLLAEMMQRGVGPTVSTYNSLINGYGMLGRLQVAEELLLEMQNQGLNPDCTTYTSLIRAYGKQNLTDKAVNVFLRMRKKGIAPSTQTYTTLISSYSEGGWHERAEAAFSNMTREGLQPTVEVYTALLDAYRRVGNWVMAQQVWKTMKEEGCKLSVITYNTLMDAFAKQGRFDEAREVMVEMKNNGIEPDLLTYNMLLNAYGRAGLNSKFPKIMREIRDAGYEPDSFTYCTLIYASLRARDFTSAFKWEKEMSEEKQRPDWKTYMKMKYLLTSKFREKQEHARKAALGQLKSLRKEVRKNPQRRKTFKKEARNLMEGPLAGYKRKKKTGKLSEKDKALWKNDT